MTELACWLAAVYVLYIGVRLIIIYFTRGNGKEWIKLISGKKRDLEYRCRCDRDPNKSAWLKAPAIATEENPYEIHNVTTFRHGENNWSLQCNNCNKYIKIKRIIKRFQAEGNFYG